MILELLGAFCLGVIITLMIFWTTIWDYVEVTVTTAPRFIDGDDDDDDGGDTAVLPLGQKT